MGLRELIRREREKKRILNLPGNAHEYDFEYVPVHEYSPFRDKKICVLGSSVAYGACSDQLAVAEYFSRTYRCSYVKEAVSGTTLVDNGPDSYIARMKKNISIKEKFVLFVCQLSTNDATRNMPLGEISASMNRQDFDTSTITGAIEYIISYARETWDCPIAFFTGSRYGSDAYAQMVARLRELQLKWKFCILNLFEDGAFNAIPSDRYALYMNDPIHPTKAGYRDWWCPEMTRQLDAYMRENTKNSVFPLI